MTERLKTFRNRVLDSNTTSSEIQHLFCQLIKEHPRDPIIIQALGLLYRYRSRRSQPPSDDAERIFRRILLPLLIRSNTLVSAFYAMVINSNIPSACLLAVINAIKRSGKDPWWLVGVAATLRPSFADLVFRHRSATSGRGRKGSRIT